MFYHGLRLGLVGQHEVQSAPHPASICWPGLQWLPLAEQLAQRLLTDPCSSIESQGSAEGGSARYDQQPFRHRQGNDLTCAQVVAGAGCHPWWVLGADGQAQPAVQEGLYSGDPEGGS